MDELKGIDYLRAKLGAKQTRVYERYKYYEMKNRMEEFNLTMPESLKWLKVTLGWCTKSVDTLADRLIFRGFENDRFDFGQVFAVNNPDVFYDSAILSALISSCCFVYIYPGDDGFPKLQVIDGANATGVIDPTTNLLKEGYAILNTDSYGAPTMEAYFTTDYTLYYDRTNDKQTRVENPAPYPLLVPVIYRPDAVRPFGHSRISRACMQLQQEAMRTLKRSEVSAEFYSFPQKYVTGLSEDVEFDNFKATMSSFLALYQDENGQSPSVGQFTQQSMSPYTEQLRTFAGLFAGETGLTLDDLGFPSQNPSSAEAIKASHETLRLEARKAQRTFGSAFLNVGYLATCLRDQQAYPRNSFYDIKPEWEPIFEPDMSTLSLIGDGAIKLNQAVEGYIDKNVLRKLTGIEGGEAPDDYIDDGEIIEEAEEEAEA